MGPLPATCSSSQLHPTAIRQRHELGVEQIALHSIGEAHSIRRNDDDFRLGHFHLDRGICSLGFLKCLFMSEEHALIGNRHYIIVESPGSNGNFGLLDEQCS
jgi:hypothetical protein